MPYVFLPVTAYMIIIIIGDRNTMCDLQILQKWNRMGQYQMHWNIWAKMVSVQSVTYTIEERVKISHAVLPKNDVGLVNRCLCQIYNL
jgi:hypothetical protein